MINGMHALIYTTKPEEMRAFFRDVLRFPCVDAGGGRLMFALPPSELATHPADAGREHHELSFMCDDVEATVADLRARGVEFSGDVSDRGWGLTIYMVLPDATQVMLYQPRHALAPHDPGA